LVIVQVLPPIPVAAFDPLPSGCMPWTVTFTNRSIWGKTYLWDFGDTLATSTEENPTYTYYKAGEYYVKLNVTGDGGTDFHYEKVSVFQKPEVSFNVEPRKVMLPEDIIKCYNLTKYATNYLWDFGDGTTSSEKFPTHKYENLGSYNITLTAWTDNSCYDTMTIEKFVDVNGKGFVNFPNAFVPNLDGEISKNFKNGDLNNQLFYPYYEGIEQYKLEIFNRWGETIFMTKDINTGWTGYYKGKLCPQGVYIYKATGQYANGKTFTKSGDITLLHKGK
jgi:gliding motility-associated-like protein